MRASPPLVRGLDRTLRSKFRLFSSNCNVSSGKICQIRWTWLSLHLSGLARLQIDPLLTARAKPLIFRENRASGAGLIGPDPRQRLHIVRRFHKWLGCRFWQGRAAFGAVGFGVLTNINVQATVEKLNKDIASYLTLGRCGLQYPRADQRRRAAT